MGKNKVSNFGDMIFIDTVYRPSIGAFGKPHCVKLDRYVVKSWFNCREIWHNHMYNAKIFFYTHPISKIKHICSFFNTVENKLSISDRTIFGSTQKKSIMYIRPSKWWLRYGMRRSLFTILLRSSNTYDQDAGNFDDALYSNSYAEKTRIAIEYFFAGNTVYKGKKRGWYRQFGDASLDIEVLKNILIPESKDHV